MSAQPRPRAWHKITSEAAAAYLAADEGRYFLRPFLEREASVSEAAELLGQPLDRTHYRVKRMLQLGILEVTRQEARAGRPVKYYRSRGDGLFVPFSLTSAADLEESRRRTNAELDARLVHAQTVAMRELTESRGDWGFRLFLDDQGATHYDFAPERAPDDFDLQKLQLQPESPAVVATWLQVPLERQQAKELQRELTELLLRYRALSEGEASGETDYLLHIGMGPLPD